MSNRLKIPADVADKKLRSLVDDGDQIIASLRARHKGFGQIPLPDFPPTYENMVNYIKNKWLQESQQTLLSIFDSPHVAKKFENISEIPTNSSSGVSGLIDEIKTRIQFLDDLIAGIEASPSDGKTVFISCGQRNEKGLGQQVATLVKNLTPYTPYFAEDQQNLSGLHLNIFDRLSSAIGFIVIMHNRGIVTTPHQKLNRASVWIEQEIAIMAFIEHFQKRKIKTLAFIDEKINLEGVRTLLQLNPTPFKNDAEIIPGLIKELIAWGEPKNPEPIKINGHTGEIVDKATEFYESLGYSLYKPLLSQKQQKLHEGFDLALYPKSGQEIWLGCNPVGQCEHILMMKRNKN